MSESVLGLIIMTYASISTLMTLVIVFISGWTKGQFEIENHLLMAWYWPLVLLVVIPLLPFYGIYYLAKFLRDKFGPPPKDETYDDSRGYL